MGGGEYIRSFTINKMDDHRSPSPAGRDMNTSIHLAKRPKGSIIPGETFEVRHSPIPKKEDVKDKECLVKVEYLSVDPGLSEIIMRG